MLETLEELRGAMEFRRGEAQVRLPPEEGSSKREVEIFSVPDAPEIFGYIYGGPGGGVFPWYVDAEDGKGCEASSDYEDAVRIGIERGLVRRQNFPRVMGAKVWPYSPSQINKYEDCPRMWGWEYLEGFRPPSKPSAAWGTEAHRQAENWFRHAQSPDTTTDQGRAVAKALPYLPAPGAHLEVEKDFRFEEDSLVFRGQVDLFFVSVDGPYVIDHKTTGDFSWALDEERLRHDTQAVIYAKAFFVRYPEVSEITLHWNYMLRTGSKPRIKQVRSKVTREEIESAFEAVKEKVREIESVRRSGKRALALPIVPTSCGKYGGCAHQERCRLTAVDRMKAIMSQEGKKMNLKEKMKARQAAKAAAQGGAPVAAPAAAPVAAPVAAAAVAPMAAPAINPPEQHAAVAPVPAPAAAPPTSAAAPANARGTTRQGRTAAAAAPSASASASASASGDESRDAFLQIYLETLRSGRAVEIADTVWDRYKRDFG